MSEILTDYQPSYLGNRRRNQALFQAPCLFKEQKQGWRRGGGTPLPPIDHCKKYHNVLKLKRQFWEYYGIFHNSVSGPGSNPGVNTIWGLRLLLVFSLAPKGFSPGIPVLSSLKKPTFQTTVSNSECLESRQRQPTLQVQKVKPSPIVLTVSLTSLRGRSSRKAYTSFQKKNKELAHSTSLLTPSRGI